MKNFFDIDNPIMQFLSKIADLVILNVITMICCIPIITVGASLSGMSYVLLRMARNEECYVVKPFFKAFKDNFKQATALWLIILAIIGVLAFDFWALRGAEGGITGIVMMGLLAVVVLFFMAFQYVFPLQARFENTVINTLKNSFLMMMFNLPKSVLMLFVWAVPVIINFTIPTLLPVLFLIGISGPSFVCALLYDKAFRKLEPEIKVEHEDEGNWEEMEARVEREKELEARRNQ